MTNEEVIKVVKSWNFCFDRSEKAREAIIKALEENEKLKEENDKLVANNAGLEVIIEQLEKKQTSQMSAVEALEWLKKWWCYDSTVMYELFEEAYNINNIFWKYTPQEIVDKIQEYEKSKDEPVSNSDKFKVGEEIKYNADLCRILLISNDYVLLSDDDGMEFIVSVSDIEHAEP